MLVRYETAGAQVSIPYDKLLIVINKVQVFPETFKISMLFLLSYSLNLNPIKRLWKLMNEQILNNRYYEKFNDFKD